MKWPPLSYAGWRDTCETLQLWMQIVGKIRMEKSPSVNHWWHVTLYVTSRGLGTSPIPNDGGTFEIEFDFIAHRLMITTSGGDTRGFELRSMSVADFYQTVIDALASLKIAVKIDTMPSEVTDPVPFEKDRQHKSYDPEAASRFWNVLVPVCQVMTQFRSRFIGKVSPVHFFWGGFDLAVTRFSGRVAPVHPSIPGLRDSMVREAYSHECSSVGFWPGGPNSDTTFYSYAYPEPDGYPNAAVKPAAAFYSNDLHEFMLPYDAVRTASSPPDTLLKFFQSTYDAAADLGRWPRAQLERRSSHGVA